MFTGIIESLGQVKTINKEGTNIHFTIESPISSELTVDQSIAHNGVCLTVTSVKDNSHRVTAIAETLDRSALKQWVPSSKINLERSLKLGDRLDGHMVQGHVDTTASCIKIDDSDGSWLFRFRLKEANKGLMVEKGSICIDGVSLTIVDVINSEFSVAIIPYTYEHTIFHSYTPGMQVNIEYDMMGKYILKWLEQSGKTHLTS